MDSSIRRQLAAAAAGRRLVKVTRLDPDQEPQHGYPLALGRTLLLLLAVHPDLLLPDGFLVVRMEDVATVHSGEWENVVERALADEARLPDAASYLELRLGGWAQLLADLQARGERVIVECEGDEEGFFLGAVLDVRRGAVEIRHIGSDGGWEDESWLVDYPDITRVRFGTRYIDVFSRCADAREAGSSFPGEAGA